MDVFLAGGIFLVAYALIASERVDRTLVALLGGLLVVALGVIDQEEAFAAIDFNVICLLAGMMVLVGGLSQTASSSTSLATPSICREASTSGLTGTAAHSGRRSPR